MIGMAVLLAAHLHGLAAVVVQIIMVMQIKGATARPHLLAVLLLGIRRLHRHHLQQQGSLTEDMPAILLRLMINKHPDMASHMQWVLLLAWPHLLLVLGLCFKIMVMRAVLRLLRLQVMLLRLHLQVICLHRHLQGHNLASSSWKYVFCIA